LLVSYLGLSVAGGLAYFVWDTFTSVVAPAIAGAGRASRSVVLRNLGLAGQVLLIVVVASFFHKAPEFVYRAF
jgi:hypothetical protein